MTVAILLLIAGAGLLLVGAESLVRGASKLASLLGISPLIIGLTIVAYGTSTLRRRSLDYSSRRHRAFGKHDDSRSTSASEY